MLINWTNPAFGVSSSFCRNFNPTFEQATSNPAVADKFELCLIQKKSDFQIEDIRRRVNQAKREKRLACLNLNRQIQNTRNSADINYLRAVGGEYNCPGF